MKTKHTDQEIKKGTTIHSETPFVYVLKSKFRTERCDTCFRRAQLSRCSGCQYTFYCGRDCQKQSWIFHKHECSHLKKVAPRIIPDAARLMARIIYKLKAGGDQEKAYYSKKSFRKFKDLMSHYSDLKQDAARLDHFTSLCAVLMEFLGESSLPNSAELMGIFGRMCVNAFNILDPEMHGIGTGIYLGASIIDHSCDPNAVAVFQGTTIYIRTLVDMPLLDWTKIRITYIDLLNTAKDRQAELQTTYYFLCDCTKCLDDKESKYANSILCPAKTCQDVIPVFSDSSLVCPSCSQHIKEATIKEYLDVKDFTLQQLQLMKDITYLDVCKICLKRQENLFHPLNIYHIKTLDLAFEASIEMAHWDQAREFGRMLIHGYRKYYGEVHPLTGIFFLKMGKINLFMQYLLEALENLKEAESILKITHGTSHILYRTELLPLLQQCQCELQAQ